MGERGWPKKKKQNWGKGGGSANGGGALEVAWGGARPPQWLGVAHDHSQAIGGGHEPPPEATPNGLGSATPSLSFFFFKKKN